MHVIFDGQTKAAVPVLLADPVDTVFPDVQPYMLFILSLVEGPKYPVPLVRSFGVRRCSMLSTVICMLVVV